MPKNKKLALNSEIQTNQILTNDDEVYIPRLSSILLAVLKKQRTVVKAEALYKQTCCAVFMFDVESFLK